ncbi:tetratricopeptide repeat protein [Aspergillus melleus]|uniref:tetratricopeptide repeat protein n=1 Tax=Aspergillus melleus TaxID=138277 RepID=UPI001E8EC866|nr:transcription factor TFIIIC subunit tfc4 [Aspergillus melleus]KAH8422545.1 transcription factor TFIIIC subunit tfc4 [Aspergillus melleus]
MEYPDPDHVDPHLSSQEPAYPDINESIHYPWQGEEQPAQTEESLHSVIDPRLYKDLFSASASQLPDQSLEGDDDEAERFAEELYPRTDDSAEDENYEYPGEESSEEDGFDDMLTDEGDGDESDSRRRRRRRRGTGPFSGRYGARGGKGIKRGPRKPLEPSPEFKILHSEATSAFIDGDYDRAVILTKQAIQTNPEMFAAHSLLSEIFLAQGQRDKALTALFSGAHTRPRDPTVWAKVAKMIMDRAGDDRFTALNDVIYCYSRVLEINPRNHNARFQRAAIYRELGHNGRAATEYERILKELPHSMRALRHIAETYIDSKEVQKAVNHWSKSVKYFTSLDPSAAPDFSWSDANIFAELYGYQGEHATGLRSLKALCRWLLGRGEDTMWEGFDEDDREWDADDSPRRIKTNGYMPGQWSRDSYGLGLPLELRIKLGLFRVKMGYEHREEALHHFEWLNPEDNSEGARLFDYGDLFREVADALKEVGLLEDALRFYMPLQQTNEYADISYFLAMGDCYAQLERFEEAENCFLTVADYDLTNIESRVQLARLYENIDMTDRALKYANEAVLLGRQESRSNRRRKDTRLENLAMEFKTAELGPEAMAFRTIAPRPSEEEEESAAPALTTAPTTKDRPEVESNRTENVQYLYSKLLQLQPHVKDGHVEATEDWLDIADALLREFRSNRIFYPMIRGTAFLGYSKEARRKANRSKSRSFIDEMQEMAGRLQETLGNDPEEDTLGSIPTDYHGISFDDWFDLFLQYALVVVDQNEADEAYDTLAAAAEASIWYHSRESTRQIHICWFTCALRAQDEEALANEARWFIKEYQFVTDTYRLFGMLSRLSGDPHRSLFHSSPNMKFMLRQIKAMDFTLPKKGGKNVRSMRPVRESIYRERAALSTRDDAGEAIPAEEMDVALLVLYGHILYSGNSFVPALNYLFRAYDLDDQNPAVILSIGLCYIHHSLKRQSENRHYLIMQGLSFMHEYRRLREQKGTLHVERQEMEFNFARVWHMLGLAHLAIEGYEKVLALSEERKMQTQTMQNGSDVIMTDAGLSQERDQAQEQEKTPFEEDFAPEAAVALQNIYALSGDLISAQEVTAKYLVI